MKKPISYYLYFFKRYEILAVSGLAILAILALSYYYLLPNFRKAQEIYSQQKLLRTRLTILRKKDELLSTIDGNVYKDNINKLATILPGSKDYVSLFNTLDNLQSKSGVTILKSDLQLGTVSTLSSKLKKDTVSPAFLMSVNLAIIGDLEQINKFINSLTDLSGRILMINKISWGDSEDGLYTVSLEGNSYFYPLPSKIGGVDSPLVQTDEKQQKILDQIATMPLQIEDDTNISVPLGKQNLFN